MRHTLALCAFAALALACNAAGADELPDFCTLYPHLCSPERPEDRNATFFDLGVDVQSVPLTKPAVNAFLADLGAQGAQVIMRTCQHYMDSPAQVQSPYTMPFCRVVVGR